MIKRLLAIIVSVTWLVLLFMRRVGIYENMTLIWLLPILFMVIIYWIISEPQYEPGEDYTKQQKKFLKGQAKRRTEDDWRRWYEDID